MLPANHHLQRRILSVLLAGLALPATARSAQPQTKTTVRPQFEVTSVKRSKSCQDGGRGGPGGGNWSPGRLTLECRTVMDLLQMAYVQYAGGKRVFQTDIPIDGGPAWISSERYDIDARAAGAPGREILSGPMMQALLEARFKLKIRREIRTVPLYDLIVASAGPKLQIAQEGKCINFDLNHPPARPTPGQPRLPWCGSIGKPYTYGVTMARLCLQLSFAIGQDVIDKTGIAGAFDIPFEWSPAELPSDAAVSGGNPPASPNQTDAAELVRLADAKKSLAKVGLLLVRAKGPRPFFVIDHVERPSEN